MSNGSTLSSGKKNLALALVAANHKTSPKTAANIFMAAKVAHLNEAHMKRKTLRKIKAEHATVYLCNLEESDDYTGDGRHGALSAHHGDHGDLNSTQLRDLRRRRGRELLRELNTSQDKKFVRLRQVIKHGDILEDVSVSGYRSTGIYFFDRSKHTIKLVKMNRESFFPDEIEFITQIHNPHYYYDGDYSTWEVSSLSFDKTKKSQSQIEGFASIIHIPKKKLKKYSSLITEDDIDKHQMDMRWLSDTFEDGSTNRFKIEYKGLTYFIESNIDPVHLDDTASPNDWYVDLQYDDIKVFGTYDEDIVGGKPKSKPKPKSKSK